MKIRNGKTMRRLLQKNASSSGKPMIRKIEDGEDLMPPEPCPLPPWEEDDDEDEDYDELWKLSVPEVGHDLCDQDEPLYPSKSQAREDPEPLAIVGNVMLLSANVEDENHKRLRANSSRTSTKETDPMSPVSVATTEPATPEEMSPPTQASILPTTSTVTDAAQAPESSMEQQEEETLWNRIENNNPLPTKLFDSCGTKDWSEDPILQQCQTFCPQTSAPTADDENTKSLFDATILQGGGEGEAAHAETEPVLSESREAQPASQPLSHIQMTPVESFDIPPLPTLKQSEIYNHSADEDRPFDECRKDEVDRDVSVFLEELEEEEQELQQEQNDKDDDNENQSAFLTVANSVVESVKTHQESVLQAAESVVAQTAETVATHTSSFHGFFDNPSKTMRTTEEGSDHGGSQDSPVASEPLAAAQPTKGGFDSMVSSYLDSETFSMFTVTIPQVYKKFMTGEDTKEDQEENATANPQQQQPLVQA
eukprot:scaffold5347_cov130-Cylindrotheca_fusiformis.AAC.4